MNTKGQKRNRISNSCSPLFSFQINTRTYQPQNTKTMQMYLQEVWNDLGRISKLIELKAIELRQTLDVRALEISRYYLRMTTLKNCNCWHIARQK